MQNSETIDQNQTFSLKSLNTPGTEKSTTSKATKRKMNDVAVANMSDVLNVDEETNEDGKSGTNKLITKIKKERVSCKQFTIIVAMLLITMVLYIILCD